MKYVLTLLFCVIAASVVLSAPWWALMVTLTAGTWVFLRWDRTQMLKAERARRHIEPTTSRSVDA